MNRAVACIHDQHQMMVCGDPINLPTGFNVSNAIHTVQVGMTAADQLAGDVAIACSVAIDVAVLWAATQGGDTSLLGALGSLFFGGAGLEHGPALKKAAASLITSTITSAGNDWNTPITLKAEIGPAQFTQEIEVSIHPRTGKTHGKAESTLESKREREWGKPL